MKAFAILYVMLLTFIFWVDWVIDYRSFKKAVITKINIKRVIVPFRTLMVLFLISILVFISLAVSKKITDGFLNNISIVLGVVAIIYIIEYLYETFKMRKYDMVKVNCDSASLMNLIEMNLIVKKGHYYYVLRGDINMAIDALADSTIMPFNWKKLIAKNVAMYVVLSLILIAIILFV